ncbi:MAG: hypothetical protein HXY40_15645 [Chloroflexi bacterium]|nr:hypothetical protein [Chloroflexota bacterium]
MRKIIKRLGIILVSSLVSLLLLEISIRASAGMLPRRLALAAHYAITGERYEANHTTGSTTFTGEYGPALLPGLQDALLPLSPSVQVHVTTIDLWGSEIGFRTLPIDYFVDTVFVDDSHTLCFTEYADCWVTRFAEETGLGVVNLGQSGTGSMSHWRILQRFAPPLTLRLVIWQFFGNDFNEDYGLAVLRGEIAEIPEEARAMNEMPLLLAWLRRNSAAFAVTEAALFGEWAYLSDYEQLFVAPYRASYRDGTLQFGLPYEALVMDLSRAHNAAGVPFTRAALKQAHALVRTWGGTLVVLVLPSPSEVYAYERARQRGALAVRLGLVGRAGLLYAPD